MTAEITNETTAEITAGSVAEVTPHPVHAWPVLQAGTGGHAVRALQYLLRARGHLLTTDGRFGLQTTAAVLSVQRRKGLVPDGVVGPGMWTAVVVQVQRGSVGQAVRALQHELAWGGAGVSVDGVFGPATERALRRLQPELGLRPDGVVGPVTWRALLSRRVRPLPEGPARSADSSDRLTLMVGEGDLVA